MNNDNKIENYGLNAVCTHLGCVVPWVGVSTWGWAAVGGGGRQRQRQQQQQETAEGGSDRQFPTTGPGNRTAAHTALTGAADLVDMRGLQRMQQGGAVHGLVATAAGRGWF